MLFMRLIFQSCSVCYTISAFFFLGNADASTWAVKYATGNTYLQPKIRNIDNTKKLATGVSFESPFPFALVSAKSSYLELEQKRSFPIALRLGQSTAIEVRGPNDFFFFQGSALFSHRKNIHFTLSTSSCETKLHGIGTWLIQKTDHQGFKIIVLEGEFKAGNEKVDGVLNAGDLAIVSGEKGLISQNIKIELPLLLSSCRLLNNFPTTLHSKSRLISAAQVQSIRMKKKYEAFVGQVSPENKVRLWTVKEKAEE